MPHIDCQDMQTNKRRVVMHQVVMQWIDIPSKCINNLSRIYKMSKMNIYKKTIY